MAPRTYRRSSITNLVLLLQPIGGEQPDYLFGLKDVFTPFSSGQININTANAYVLQMIPGVDGNIATNIMEYREGVNNDATDPSFKSVNQLGAAGISQAVVQQMTPYCGVMSYTWQVNITATIGQDHTLFSRDSFSSRGQRHRGQFRRDD